MFLYFVIRFAAFMVEICFQGQILKFIIAL